MTGVFRYRFLFFLLFTSFSSTAADTKTCKKTFYDTQNPYTKTSKSAVQQESMVYTILLSSKAEKQITRLPAPVQKKINQLLDEIQETGPIRRNWSNFSQIYPKKDNKYHCHLKKGNPTYVACWNQPPGTQKTVKFNYIGTHEKAPY